MPTWAARSATEPNWSPKQRSALQLGRSQFGLHYKLTKPYDVQTEDLMVPLPKTFAKDTMVTVGIDILPDKFMELCYEAIDDRNKFLYVRLDPEDNQVYIGTKLVLHQNLHRYELELNKDSPGYKNFKRGPRVIQFRWDKGSDKLQVLLDGENVLKQQVNGSLFNNFANVAQGEEYMGDKGRKMCGFRVHEVHFTSPDVSVLTDQNATFYFKPYFHVYAEGSIIFKGIFKPRQKKTNEIEVLYEGERITGLKGAKKNEKVTVTIKFGEGFFTVEMEGSKNDRVLDMGELDKIGMFAINRNMIVQDVAAFTGSLKYT
ncbi:uncharacterized protein LOC144149033 [Haemaphysalis longicornis]